MPPFDALPALDPAHGWRILQEEGTTMFYVCNFKRNSHVHRLFAVLRKIASFSVSHVGERH